MTLVTAPQILELLWEKEFFEIPRSFGEIKNEFVKLKHHHTDQNIYSALNTADYLTKKGSKRNYRYAQRRAFDGIVLTREVLPPELIKKMEPGFMVELKDLKLNYGKSGTCTSFLLRKILEKLIYIVMAKIKKDKELVSDAATGRLHGLEKMIDIVSKQKEAGRHLLMPKTAEKISGIKFLGDTAAHNPLVNVEMETIVPVMPFIVTAYQELTNNL